MSTAEEFKAEMFGDNPPAGHHDGGPLLAKLERHPLPLARFDYTRVDDAGQIISQIAAPTPGARPVGHGRAIRFPGARTCRAQEAGNCPCHTGIDDIEHVATAERTKADGHTAKDIAKYLGVSRAIMYR
jgi:hypothetical protein